MSNDRAPDSSSSDSAEIRRRDVFVLGVGAAVAAVAAASTVAGPAVGTAGASPRPGLKERDFTLLADDVPVSGVRNVVFEPVRTVLNRAIDGAISWGFVQGTTLVRIFVEDIQATPFPAWQAAARTGGQPPTHTLRVRVGRESGRNPQLALSLTATICHLERVAAFPPGLTGPALLIPYWEVVLRCAVGLGAWSVARPTTPAPASLGSSLVAHIGPAGGTLEPLGDLTSAVGGDELFDTGQMPDYGTDPFATGRGVSPLVLVRPVDYDGPAAPPLVQHLDAILGGTAPAALDVDITHQRTMPRKTVVMRTLEYRRAFVRSYTFPTLRSGSADPVLETFELVPSSVSAKFPG